MKKTYLIAFLILIGFAPHVFAEGFTALAPIPGLTQGVTSVVNSDTLSTFFNNLYRYLIGLAATIAVIQIIWSGLDIAFFHKDAVATIVDDKGKIYNAIFGLVLVLSPYLVFSIINPSILNLSLSLPPISLDAPSGAANGGTGAPIADTTTGCSVSGTAGILQIATCSSAAAATAWGQQNCSSQSLALYTTDKTNSSNGVATYIDTCSGNKDYTFISKSGVFLFMINRVQPLVRTPTNPNNGSDAMNFTTICQSAGLDLQTCINNDPGASINRPVPCTIDPAGPNAGTTWECYTENLTCRDASIANLYCKGSPSWTPFN